MSELKNIQEIDILQWLFELHTCKIPDTAQSIHSIGQNFFTLSWFCPQKAIVGIKFLAIAYFCNQVIKLKWKTLSI